MQTFAQQCLELRKQDHTLQEIAAITGKSKSSVYFHIRNLHLSRAKMSSIRSSAQARARELAAQRKGVSARTFITFEKWTEGTVSLVAHLLFDGEIRRSGCTYNNRNSVLITKVAHSMEKIYAYSPNQYLNTSTGVLRISYFNVALSIYLQRKADELLHNIVKLPRHLQQEFLKAFFDDEGCMDFRPNRNVRQVRGYQKDISILKIVKKLLENLGIESVIKQPNEVVVRGKENLLEFQKEIGFSQGVRINGNRPNSIWKKSLEKREILQRALDSYKTFGQYAF
jgi:hypothetical protein